MTPTGSMTQTLPVRPVGSSAGRRVRASDPRVLLLDQDAVQTLYLADGLVRAGCAVRVLSSMPSARPPRRRRGLTLTTAPGIATAAYVAVLDDVLESWTPDFVVVSDEDVFARLWDANPPWSDRIFPVTEPWQRELVRSKQRMIEFVAAHGVTVPEFRSAHSDAELGAAVAALGCPVVVKGETGLGGSAVRICASEEAALDAARDIRERTGRAPFLQRYIEGPVFIVGGVFDHGTPLRLWAAEKVETYPPKTGPSVRQLTTHARPLLDQISAAVGALQWTGLASGDFVRGADGTFYFLEINPRAWGSLSAATAAGVDILAPFAQLLLGGTPRADLSFRAGVETATFPQYLLAQLRTHGVRVRAIARLLASASLWRGVPWRRPRLALDVATWTYWRSREWSARRRRLPVSSQ